MRGVDDTVTRTYYGLTSSSDDNAIIKFGSVDENNEIIAMITTKKFHHKCVYKTKYKQCLNIYKTNIIIQFKL